MSATQRKFKVTSHEVRTLSWWKIRRDQIDMDPPYQRRGHLWSHTDKAYLIDSILNGFDVPKFYFADFNYSDSDLNVKRRPYAIIDGKQRLEAIFDFYAGRVTLNRDFVFLENSSLKLGGLGYKDLAQNYASIAEIFDNFNLAVMSVITDSEELINQLFVRLNRSKPLTGAEVRNAMAGPAPEVIRQIANHEFFREMVAFSVKRGGDLNAAAKFLFFEFFDAPQETKKTSLDTFVELAAEKPEKLELAGLRTQSMLDVLSGIFLPKDRLLASAGILPVYYWFIRGLSDSEHSRVRDFLMRFEEARKENRTLSQHEDLGLEEQDIDAELIDYDRYNRSTNDLSSHRRRVAILQTRFAEFVSTD